MKRENDGPRPETRRENRRGPRKFHPERKYKLGLGPNVAARPGRRPRGPCGAPRARCDAEKTLKASAARTPRCSCRRSFSTPVTHGPTAPPTMAPSITVPKIEPKCGPSKISAAIGPDHGGQPNNRGSPAPGPSRRAATRWPGMQRDQRHEADDEPGQPIVHTHSRPIRSDRWPNMIWPGTPDQADQAERPGGLASAKRRSRSGISSGAPAPRTRRRGRRNSRAQSTRSAPCAGARAASIRSRSTRRRRYCRRARRRRARRRRAVRPQADILRPRAQQQIERQQQAEHQHARARAGECASRRARSGSAATAAA